MSKEETFWNWFRGNNSRYFYLNQLIEAEKKEGLLNEFLEQLHKYCDKLSFEIGGVANEPQELIISAEGNVDYFDKVEALVAKAPKINDWQIIAFKPPISVDFVTDYEGIRMAPREMWFLPLENEGAAKALGLMICLPNYNPEKKGIILEGCYQLLDTILGEKSVALDIQHVEVNKLPSNSEKNGLIELSELSKYISWRKTKEKK